MLGQVPRPARARAVTHRPSPPRARTPWRHGGSDQLRPCGRPYHISYPSVTYDVTTRRLAPEQRRALIVEAAGGLFGERGYDGTRLDASGRRGRGSRSRCSTATSPTRRRSTSPCWSATGPTWGPSARRSRPTARLRRACVRCSRSGWTTCRRTATPWRMLFRDTGGGPEVRAFRVEVHAEARAVLAGLIRHLAPGAAPRARAGAPRRAAEHGDGLARAVVIETPGVEREAVLDAIARVWTGVLTPRTAPPPAWLEDRQPRRHCERHHVVGRAGDQARLGAAVAGAHRFGSGPEHERADQDHPDEQHELRHPAVADDAPVRRAAEQQAGGSAMKLSGIPKSTVNIPSSS